VQTFAKLRAFNYRLRTRHLHCQVGTLVETCTPRYAFLAKVIWRSFELSEWMLPRKKRIVQVASTAEEALSPVRM
jgi:hypothetical protein